MSSLPFTNPVPEFSTWAPWALVGLFVFSRRFRHLIWGSLARLVGSSWRPRARLNAPTLKISKSANPKEFLLTWSAPGAVKCRLTISHRFESRRHSLATGDVIVVSEPKQIAVVDLPPSGSKPMTYPEFPIGYWLFELAAFDAKGIAKQDDGNESISRATLLGSGEKQFFRQKLKLAGGCLLVLGIFGLLFAWIYGFLSYVSERNAPQKKRR